MIGTTGDKLL